MAPAAFHRIATRGDDTSEVNTFGSYAMLGAMLVLALSMAGECYVVIETTAHSTFIALVAALVALAVAYGLWFGIPLTVRRRRASAG
jgi:hypothetical protein